MDGIWIEINVEKQIGPRGGWDYRMGFGCKKLEIGIMIFDEENQSGVIENAIEIP